MAQSGYAPISLYYSSTATNVPTAGNLVNGELAINITDGKLYYKNNSGTVTLLASSANASPVTTFSAGTTGFTPSTATSGAVTLSGTLNVLNGGTGVTTATGTGSVVLNTSPTLVTPNIGAANATSVAIGTLSYAAINVLYSAQSSASSYNQMVLQNSNTGTTASTDYIVSNSNSTDTTYYGDFGMNSSGFTGTGAFNTPNMVYLTSTTTDLAIGTTTANAIHFVINGGADSANVNGTTGVWSFANAISASITGTAANITGIVAGANGGTGVANTGKTITLGGNLTTSGAFATTLTTTNTTTLTLPTSGTVLSSVTAPAANPVTGTPSSSNFLRGDGTWATPVNSGGTVTSVAASVPAFLSISGSPITTSGTLAISYSGTALPVANGGTGITTTPSNGFLPIGNGTNYTAAALTAGVGVSITNASGSITIANTQTPVSTTSSATISVAITAAQYNVNALAVSSTISMAGAGVDGQKIVIRIKDNGTSQSLTWTTTSNNFRVEGVTLPSATTVSTPLYVGCVYNAQDSFWDVIAVS